MYGNVFVPLPHRSVGWGVFAGPVRHEREPERGGQEEETSLAVWETTDHTRTRDVVVWWGSISGSVVQQGFYKIG